MKPKKWIIICFLIGCMSLTVGFKHEPVKWDFNYSPVSELPQEADAGDYIPLLAEGGTCQVKQGDTLWEIAEKQYGDGSLYPQLVEMNRETLTDPNLILPEQRLILPEIWYLPKSHTPDTDSCEGAFQIEYADVKSFRDPISANIKLGNTISGIRIYTGWQTNPMGYNALTQDWEAFVSEVERSSREICGDRVNNLTFEKYRMADGCDLCGYSFTFEMGKELREVAVFYRFGRQNMAEIIGTREREIVNREGVVLKNAVRYVAASFEDLGGEIVERADRSEEKKIEAGDWKYPSLQNPFAILMDNYGIRILGEETKAETEEDSELTWEEPQFEQAVRNLLVRFWRMDEEEEKAFRERPVMESDLAMIKTFSCDVFYHTTPAYEKKVWLTFGGDDEVITLAGEQPFSFADIAHFSSVESMRLTGMTDYSFLSKMPGLESLTISSGRPTEDLGFLADCKGLRVLGILGDGFGMVTDLTVLSNMKGLEKLTLETPRAKDFSFLKECTQIRGIWLEGKRSDGEPSVTPDLELLPNAVTVEFYGEKIR